MNQLFLIQGCHSALNGLSRFMGQPRVDPQNMEHLEDFLKNHSPEKHNFLNYIEPGKPSGFECTFEEGLCDGWEVYERQVIKDPRTNITENVGQWMVLQGSFWDSKPL